MFWKKKTQELFEEPKQASLLDSFGLISFYVAPDGQILSKVDWPDNLDAAQKTMMAIYMANAIKVISEGQLFSYIRRAVQVAGERKDMGIASSILSQLPDQMDDDDEPCVSAEEIFSYGGHHESNRA